MPMRTRRSAKTHSVYATLPSPPFLFPVSLHSPRGRGELIGEVIRGPEVIVLLFEDIVVFFVARLIISFQMGNCFCSKKKYGGYDSDEKIYFKRGNVHVITCKESWDEKILEANKHGMLVVANFSASWCGPCRMIAPLFSELSEKYPSITFLTLDVDEMADFGSSWDIRATPTFFFLRDGQQVDKLVGANKQELQKKVATYAESSSQLS